MQKELAHLERKTNPRLAKETRAKWNAIEKSVRHHPKRDNVRDVGLKTHGRPVPQKRYRLGYPSLSSDAGGHPEGPLRFAWTASPAGVRVKWCGKSAPLRPVTPGAG
jgi:hypothetical protein